MNYQYWWDMILFVLDICPLDNVLGRELRMLNVTAKQINRSKLQNVSYV